MNISVAEISKRLAAQAETVALMLLPGGKRMNGDWCAGDLAGGSGKSLKVALDGEHAGRWRDWAGGDESKGDLLDLWRETRSLTPGEAVKQAKDFLGIVELQPERKRSYGAPPQEGTQPLTKSSPAYRYLSVERDLAPSTLNRFKVETQGDTIAFPCYSPSGTLENRSYRTLPRDGERKKVWQEKGCAPCLFGWHALPPSAFDTRTVLLCEGQIDCMTWHQWGIAALSIPNGSGGTWIEHEWDNLAVFDHLYLSFDMDGAGAENLDKTMLRLGQHRCLVVSLPHKDANDCLLKGCTDEDAQQWIAAARPPSVSGLVKATDLRKRLLEEIRPKPEPFTLPMFRIRWPHDGLWFRPGEVTVWVGTTSAGKSTFLNFLSTALIAFEMPVFIASMEVRAEVTLRRMMSPYAPADSLTNESAERFLNHVGHMIIFADVVGYIKQDKLLEMMRFAFQRYGVSHFIVDSLMRIEGLEEDYPAQGTFLNILQEFAKSSGAHIHLVAHAKKIGTDARPSTNDIKGSSLIGNNADNVIAITRNPEKDKLAKDGTLSPEDRMSMHDTEIRVEKQRETGWARSFFLRFNPITYSFTKMDSPNKAVSKTAHRNQHATRPGTRQAHRRIGAAMGATVRARALSLSAQRQLHTLSCSPLLPLLSPFLVFHHLQGLPYV